MKYLYRLAAFTVFFSFIFGFIWSVYLKKPNHMTHTYTLTLLLPNHLEALDFSKSITSNSDIMVTPLVYKSFVELETLLEKKHADAVIIPSATASRLIETQLIPHLPERFLNLLSFIHVDFKSLRFDPDNSFTFPLFWGVNGLASAKTNNKKDVRLSRIDDFVQKHFLNQRQKKSDSPSEFHSLAYESLLKAKTNYNLVQLPASFFPMFESLPAKNDQQWTFSIPENEGDFWILSLALLNPEKINETEAFLEFLLDQNFESTFLKKQPLGITYLTLQRLSESQRPQFLRTLPLKRIQIRDLSISDLRSPSEEVTTESK